MYGDIWFWNPNKMAQMFPNIFRQTRFNELYGFKRNLVPFILSFCHNIKFKCHSKHYTIFAVERKRIYVGFITSLKIADRTLEKQARIYSFDFSSDESETENIGIGVFHAMQGCLVGKGLTVKDVQSIFSGSAFVSFHFHISESVSNMDKLGDQTVSVTSVDRGLFSEYNTYENAVHNSFKVYLSNHSSEVIIAGNSLLHIIFSAL